MMEHLVLHPTTKRQAGQFAAHPGHALLLAGPRGCGKTALAHAIAGQVLQHKAPLAAHPYVSIIAPDEKGSISIDAVRELQRFLRLKTTGRRATRRAAIIEQADALTLEAQHALLKLLEEPPADTLLILTAANIRALLRTIRSRVQQITVREPEEQALKEHCTDAGKHAGAVEQAYLLSGGLPGLMYALLEQDADHPLFRGVAQAKQLLAGSQFERMCAVDTLSKQKQDALTLLQALSSIAQACLRQAAVQRDTARMRQWHRIRKEVMQAQEALQHNANAKLVLSKFMLHM